MTMADLLNGRDLDSLTEDEKMALLAQSGIVMSDATPPSAAPVAPAPPSAAAAADPELATEGDRIAYLRARGVEVDLAEERGKTKPAPPAAGGRTFGFVCIPAEDTHAVAAERTAAGGSDVLSSTLAPRFATDAAMDDATVARETAGRLRNMVAAGGGVGADTLKAPSASTMASLSAGGSCEAYPLSRGEADNGWRSVRLYIDEVDIFFYCYI